MTPGKLRVSRADYAISVYPNNDVDLRPFTYIHPYDLFIYLGHILSRTDKQTRYALVLTKKGVVGLCFEDVVRARTVEASSEDHPG